MGWRTRTGDRPLRTCKTHALIHFCADLDPTRLIRCFRKRNRKRIPDEVGQCSGATCLPQKRHQRVWQLMRFIENQRLGGG